MIKRLLIVSLVTSLLALPSYAAEIAVTESLVVEIDLSEGWALHLEPPDALVKEMAAHVAHEPAAVAAAGWWPRHDRAAAGTVGVPVQPHRAVRFLYSDRAAGHRCAGPDTVATDQSCHEPAGAGVRAVDATLPAGAAGTDG